MADFGIQATTLQAPQGAGADPVQGVMTPTSSFTLPTGLLDIGVQLVQGNLQAESDRAKAIAEANKNAVISGYVEQIESIAINGRNAGLSAYEIAARQRAVGSTYASQAASMGILEDLDKARKAVLGLGVSGEIEDDAKRARAQRVKDEDFLRSNGYNIRGDTPDEVVEDLMDSVTLMQQELKRHERWRKSLEEDRADGKYTREEAARIDAERSQETLNKFAASRLEGTAALLKDIANKTKEGAAGYDTQSAAIMVAQSRMQTMATLNMLGQDNEKVRDSWSSIFQDLFTAAEKSVLDTSANVGKDLDLAINTAALAAAQRTPEALSLASAQKLFGQTITGTLTAENLASQILPQIGLTDYSQTGTKVNNIVGSPTNKTAELEVYANVRAGLGLVKNGQALYPEQSRAEAFQATNNLLFMLGEKANQTGGYPSPEDLKEIVKFMDTPEFGYFVQQGGLNPDIASFAKRAYQRFYQDSIDGQVKKSLFQSLTVGTAGGPGGTSSSGVDAGIILDAIDIKYQDGKIQFIPRDTDTSTGRARAVARQISNLSDEQFLINRNLRIAANLAGTVDYQKYWEQNKSALFPYIFADDERVSKPVEINGVMWQYIGPPGGNTRDKDNWKRVDNGGTE